MTSAANVANRVPITIALMLATLMVTLDGTIANVALPHIQGSLSASQDQVTWVLTSYIIATALMIPLSGWLSQKFGRKRLLLISVSAFTLASMLCGVATTLPEIVVFRLLQGAAGASLMPLSQTVMLDIFPLRMIPQVMSLWSSVIMIGPIVGPALGGWLTENASWRFVFYINLPVGVMALIMITLFMAPDDGGRQRPFDFLGFGALVAFIGALQLMLDRGPNQDWFESPEIWTEAIVAMIGLYVFVVQTLTAEHPFFHRDLARDRNFAGATAFSFCVGALLFSTTALLPTLMQNLLGYSVLQSGYASLPRGVGSLAAFIIVPILMRRLGVHILMTAGIFISGLALWLMHDFDLSMTTQPIMTAGYVQGFGTGLLFAPLNSLAYATLNPVHRAEATTINNMSRNLGSSVGISTMQATLVWQSARAHAALAGHVQQADPVARAAAPQIVDATTAGLMALNAEVTRQGAMIAYDRVFEIILVGSMILFPLLWMMKAPPKTMDIRLEATD